MLLIALVGGAVFSAMLALVGGWLEVIAVRVLLGLFAGGTISLAYTMGARLAPSERSSLALSVLASRELRDGLRNRWVLAVTILLAALALALAFLGSAPVGEVGAAPLEIVVVSLASLSILLVPLIALLLSFDAIVGEAERGTLLLLLAGPVTRWQIVLGKFVGQIAILTAQLAQVPVTVDPGEVILPASTPTEPSSPNHKLNIALGAFLGLFIGIVGAFVRDRMDDRIRDRADLEFLTFGGLHGAVSEHDVAQLVSHDACHFGVGLGRLDHSAMQEHRAAWQRKRVDLFQVDDVERIAERRLLELARYFVDQTLADLLDEVIGRAVVEQRHLFANFLSRLTAKLDILRAIAGE